MRFHASLPPSNFGHDKDAETTVPQSNHFRNMFCHDNEVKRFAGHGRKKAAQNRRMLERLAVRITKEGESAADGPDSDIPAGYTYLAQLVGHDLVHSVPSGVDPAMSQPTTLNLRAARLLLDTIYGRGPDASPAAYAVPQGRGRLRTRLRLGRCRQDGARPAGGPALDIPRTVCPHLDNMADRGATEALLADPRNDVSLILSQLTVLFHLLHNRIEDRLAVAGQRSGRHDRDEAVRRFADARKATAFVFRSIVTNDLMKRLLCKETYERLETALSSGSTAGFLDDVEDDRIAYEFSHAAHRIGHAMVRGTYAVNDEHTFTGVKDIVRFTSSRRPHEMPLASDWLVQWSKFFKLGGSHEPNFSRRIRPAVAPALGVNDLFAPQDDEYGGLVLSDLLRGAETCHCSVGSLIERLSPKEKTHPFLANPTERAKKIAQWLGAGDSAADGDSGFDQDDIKGLSQDPPLLFFILMEAAETQDGGKRLGPVGSTIVGETVYGALYRTRSLIEDDPGTKQVVATAFGGHPPDTMPDLIRHLVAAEDLPAQ